jgi:flagellar biosynthetic protein FliR
VTVHLPALSGLIFTYMLVFGRVGAMVMLLPAIGEMGVPSRVRLVLALAIALALTPQVQANYPAVAPTTFLQLSILVLQEVTAGVLVGAMARIIMSALSVAGALIATQTGLAYAQTIDPTQNTQGAVVGNFMTLLGTTLIFATNLHHLAIGAVAGSYRMLPPGAHLFSFAVYCGLGVLARLMPQLQVFFVAVPINILCGFFILLAVVGALMSVFLDYYSTQMAVFL